MDAEISAPPAGSGQPGRVVHSSVDNPQASVDNSWALVVCAHGTDDPAGQQTTRDIVAAVALTLPGVPVSCAHVDVQTPTLDEEVERLVGLGHRVAIVPVLLSTGFHVQVDVQRAVRAHPGRVVSSGPLGPHELLVQALRGRLVEAGVTPQTPVAVAVAGSRRSGAAEAGRRVADELARQWDAPVAVGFLAACEPRLGDAIEALRAAGAGTVAVASYLTGAGVFHRMAQQAGGDITSEPLAEHPALVELVARRFREAIAGA